jgi:hypothetical protein
MIDFFFLLFHTKIICYTFVAQLLTGYWIPGNGCGEMNSTLVLIIESFVSMANSQIAVRVYVRGGSYVA